MRPFLKYVKATQWFEESHGDAELPKEEEPRMGTRVGRNGDEVSFFFSFLLRYLLSAFSLKFHTIHTLQPHLLSTFVVRERRFYVHRRVD